VKKYDVIVVGGGLAGAATTYHLTKLGYRVALFEKENIASGATGRCGGQVLQCEGKDKDPDVLRGRLQFTKRNIKLLKEYEEELDVDIEFNQVGSLDIATSEEEYEVIREIWETQKKIGDDEVELLDQGDFHKEFPYFAEFMIGARFRWSDGNINPFNLTNGLVNQSRKYGAEIYTWHNVDKVEIESGKVRGVRAKGCKFSSEKVVLATSFWTSDLIQGFGLKIFPHRPVCCVSEPYPDIRGPAFEVVIGDDITWGATQFKGGHLLVGGGAGRPRSIEEQHDYRLDWKDTVRNAAALAKIFPKLGHVSIVRCWTGTVGFTIDGFPLVGKTSRAEGLYLIGGFPAGMGLISYTAKLLADLIADREMEVDLDTYDPDRFNNLKIELPQKYNYAILEDYLGRL
jgi:glycine/D-amino acid oxidase-like deaminating enzyme